ncbi:MAG: hypothetical protein ACWGKN_10100 [Desulfoprunum sp.]|jgi:hypothetical protein|nr:hypothetical protein JT06_00710 [Desulfobulbus sp. Tol-SR]
MKNTIQVDQRVRTGVGAAGSVGTEISKVGVSVVAIFGVIVGLWSLASLVGGLVSSGGPLGLVGNWFKAVFGL